jgi:hypothetical protein
MQIQSRYELRRCIDQSKGLPFIQILGFSAVKNDPELIINTSSYSVSTVIQSGSVLAVHMFAGHFGPVYVLNMIEGHPKKVAELASPGGLRYSEDSDRHYDFVILTIDGGKGDLRTLRLIKN